MNNLWIVKVKISETKGVKKMNKIIMGKNCILLGLIIGKHS